MRKKKKLISLIFIVLFLTILYFPIINAEETINQEKILTIWMPGITKDNYFTQIELSEEKRQEFIDELYSTLNVINNTISPNSVGGSKITYEEWQHIKDIVCSFLNSIKTDIQDFPSLDTDKLATEIIEDFFNPFIGIFRPKPVFSAGIGNTWIPFYDYETFFGFMFRSMIIKYQFGFTHIGGLAQCRLTIGKFFMINTLFSGIFINLGDIGFEQIVGPTLFIGTIFLSRI
ncbi:MAG: hypothetical protein AYK22_00470 [Thermoplasmatales archaeon SG8-52-3]|nr:MAG: hypothetical protein AYK22_00470 [Thermoplasmatales archaeon SG8-52-3]